MRGRVTRRILLTLVSMAWRVPSLSSASGGGLSGPLRASCGILIVMPHSFTEIADAYLEEARGPKPTRGWATDHVMDLSHNGLWDSLWQILLAMTRREEVIDTERLAYIA